MKMKREFKRYLRMLAAAACMMFTITNTASAQIASASSSSVQSLYSEDTASDESKYTSYDEVKEIIKDYYVDDVSEDVLDAPTITEMIKKLNDPYTAYFTKEEYNDFMNTINNSFCGIGIYIEAVPQGIKILGVMKNSPSEEANIKAGDIIVKAGGVSLAGMSSENAVKYIKGAENTTVSLKILRDNKYLDFIVKRKVISEPTVDGEMLNNTAAYIRILSFGEDTPELFKEKITELKKQNPSCYIIDLRDNGGGITTSSYDIAGYFIGTKPAVIMQGKSGNKTVYNGYDHGKVLDKPVFFLVNENTASASEILSAAVKDYGKAYFIGTRTYGKGVAQNLIELIDGGVLKITTQKFFSPKGNVIQKVGITPDFEVKDSDALAVAQLLSGSSGAGKDKRGYIEVIIGGKKFEINLKQITQSKKNSSEASLVSMQEYIKAYYDILNKADKGSIYKGTSNGFVQASNDILKDPASFIFEECENKTALTDLPLDKVFTVKFSKDIDVSSLKRQSILLIDGQNGDSIETEIKNADKKTITVKAENNLKNKHEYYLVVNNNMQTINGAALRNCTAVKAVTK